MVTLLTVGYKNFSHYAELEQRTERQKLLQLELYLSGRAKQVYKVLPASAKDTFSRAIESLKKRLQPQQRSTVVESANEEKAENWRICQYLRPRTSGALRDELW